MERKVAAILHADVQGYSRLIEKDEVGTLRVLTPCLQLMNEQAQQHGGHPVGSRGDSLLAEFPSVIEAVQCAVELQHELQRRNAELPAEQRIAFRMGINLGEVVSENGQLHGDGINIAVRLESLAEAGGILISGTVYDQVEHKLPFHYDYLGEQQVKNITKPVRAYRIVLDEAAWAVVEAAQQNRPQIHRKGTPLRSRVVFVLVLVSVLLLGGIAAVQYFLLSIPSPQHSTPSTQALPLPNKPSIAVLPFTNMRDDPKQEYFSDGITEDLITDLSKFSGLFVIARNSVFTYKGKAVKVAEVARELGVRYVLEGSVRKADDQVRITAQLVDATTGHHLWSQRYDRALKDIFALQDEIIQQIVANLNVEVWQAELERVRRTPTNNLTAYDYLLRGWELHQRFTKETTGQARQMFEKAVELDPTYASAYAALGWTYHLEWAWHWSQDLQTLERWSALAQQALVLDDSLPQAHMLLSQAYLWKRQHEQAIAEGERAIVLNPNDAWGYHFLAETLNFSGKPEEALGAAEQAMRLDPRNRELHLVELGFAYRWMGRYEEAITALKRSLARYPTQLGAHAELVVCYSELGREEEARAEATEVLRISPNFSLEATKQRLPLKDPAVLERHLAALRKAGLK